MLKIPVIEFKVSLKISGKTKYKHTDNTPVCVTLAETKVEGYQLDKLVEEVFAKAQSQVKMGLSEGE